MAFDILVVDDEKDIRELIAGILEDEGYSCRLASDGVQALEEMRKRQPNLIILDVWLGDGERDGIKILETIKRDHPYVPAVMISGHSTIETAVAAIKKGAYDFIEKPFKAERLLHVVDRAVESSALKRENDELRVKTGDSAIIGKTSSIEQLRTLIREIAEGNSRAFISGLPGTGKEMVAREIHRLSRRASLPFTTFNCGSVHPSLVEAELFGTEIQGQSNSEPRKIGLVERTHGGTFYFEEIHLLPLQIQGKIVRLLQDGTFFRMGAKDPIKVDIRYFASASESLNELVSNGNLREDLYYRFTANHIKLPSLKERASDIPILVQHFMEQIAKSRAAMPRKISEAAYTTLQTYSWPGNINQLKNVVEWLLIMAGGDPLDPIEVDALPPEIQNGAPLASAWQQKSADIIILPLREARETFEREYLLAQIQRFDGNISQTARFIGMERSALHRKLRALGVCDYRE
jgi:two-component system nitrogen regulation response regulator NtrX